MLPENEELVSEGKNAKDLNCQRCSSRILNNGVGLYQEVEVNLPPIKKKVDSSAAEEEEVVKQSFVVDNMYAFENVGFSNTVGNMKYLTCADCEMGPIGWHSLDTKKSYVALTRVKHE